MKSLLFARASAVMIAALLCISLLHPHRAAAEGAIAVGEPRDVARDGYAYGYSTGKADLKAASTEALESCRKPGNGKSDAGRKLCRTVGTFTNQCVAVAMDPGQGTPGVGWAIGGTLKLAEAQAMAKCKATAGAGRQEACVIDHSRGAMGSRSRSPRHGEERVFARLEPWAKQSAILRSSPKTASTSGLR